MSSNSEISCFGVKRGDAKYSEKFKYRNQEAGIHPYSERPHELGSYEYVAHSTIIGDSTGKQRGTGQL